MNLLQAAIVFAINLMDRSNSGLPYDHQMVTDVTAAIVQVTSDPSEIETLIKISRWESGGYRKDVATCKVKGDNGQAYGLFQVHPRNSLEAQKLCSTYVEQATIALDRVRESAKMCAQFGSKGADSLAGYTRGTCVKGNPAAQLRWGSGKTILSIIEKENERLATTSSQD
jgi:hypothetical protein